MPAASFQPALAPLLTCSDQCCKQQRRETACACHWSCVLGQLGLNAPPGCAWRQELELLLVCCSLRC